MLYRCLTRGLGAFRCPGAVAAAAAPTALPTTAARDFGTTAAVLRSHYVYLSTCRRMEFFKARQVGFASRLSVLAPQVAAEWDYDRNPRHLHPGILVASTVRPVWWRCGGCGHSYEMAPEKRVVRGFGCPACAAATKAPAIAQMPAPDVSASSPAAHPRQKVKKLTDKSGKTAAAPRLLRGESSGKLMPKGRSSTFS